MNQKRGSVKLAARQRAREARTTAVAERIAREKRIDAVLATFFEADMHAETVIETAQRKADQLLTAARQQADRHREAAHEVRHALVDIPHGQSHNLNTPHCG